MGLTSSSSRSSPGRGLSSTLGVAAFPSGEVYRVDDPEPTVIVGRLFLRQVIGLGGGMVPIASGPNQLAGERDRDALTLTVGKVATTDFVDSNPVSSDPHAGFMSWGLWASAAYDYPADTRGYTYGFAADLTRDFWSIRAGVFCEPKSANGMELELDLRKARGVVAEGEARYQVGELPGAARALLFRNTADMGSYEEALAESPTNPGVTNTRAQGRTKTGFAASANQDLGQGLAAFLRLSYNDGRTESWAFTEIDRSVAGGLVQSGWRWGRSDDRVGLGLVVSGLSAPHRNYLAAGGYGFIIGDGRLNYALEVLAEAYYMLAVTREVSAGVNYQAIFNPAYNRDRGPVQVLTGRVHVAFQEPDALGPRPLARPGVRPRARQGYHGPDAGPSPRCAPSRPVRLRGGSGGNHWLPLALELPPGAARGGGRARGGGPLRPRV